MKKAREVCEAFGRLNDAAAQIAGTTNKKARHLSVCKDITPDNLAQLAAMYERDIESMQQAVRELHRLADEEGNTHGY